jgi:LysR family glycine cleavage system transcriptional activator
MSFTKAADEMNVTQGAVSRQVKVLEEYLGFKLFERTSKGLELSRNGRGYARMLSQAFEQIALATDEVLTVRRNTVLTIRGYTTFLVRWLVPLLPEFKIKHPNIEIRLFSASDPVDFERDNADLGIRYGHGYWQNTDSDLLFLDSLFPVCSPALMESAELKVPTDLSRCTLLHLKLRRRDWPDWLAGAGRENLTAENNLFFEDLGVVYECAVAGMGVAMGQQAYVEADLAAHRLVAPFEFVLKRPAGYFLVCPKDRAHLMKIRIFKEWLRARIAAEGLGASPSASNDLSLTAAAARH